MSFEKALKKLKTGVVIVTTKYENKINGMTAAWYSRVSWDPAMVMVSIAKQHLTKEMIEKSKIFAINILSVDQIELGKHFGMRSGRDFDKFKDIEYTEGKTGCPLIEDCASVIECELFNAYDAGDHIMFVGTIVHVQTSDNDPIEYKSSDYFG